MSLFGPGELEQRQAPAVIVKSIDKRTVAMHALARLKQFRAGRITLRKPEINRDLDAVFQFVEEVTT